MTTRSVTVTHPATMQNQDIARFIECANSYKSSIALTTKDGKINAKSLLGVLALGLCEGMQVDLYADGPDEIEALDTLSSRLDARNNQL